MPGDRQLTVSVGRMKLRGEHGTNHRTVTGEKTRINQKWVKKRVQGTKPFYKRTLNYELNLKLKTALPHCGSVKSDAMGDSHWNKMFLKDGIPGNGPTTEQFGKNCSLWEGLVLEKFLEDCLPWEGSHAGVGEREERSNETMLKNWL